MISSWIAIPLKSFKNAHYVTRNANTKSIMNKAYKYYLLFWIGIVFCMWLILCIFIYKIRDTMNRTYKYQSMFILNKAAVSTQRRSIEIKLCQWMFVISGIIMYLIMAIIAYIFVYIYGNSFENSFSYFILINLSGYTILNFTVFYFIRMDYNKHNKGLRESFAESNDGVPSNVVLDDEREDDHDMDDDDMELSLSATSNGTLTNSTRFNQNFTQIIYLQD